MIPRAWHLLAAADHGRLPTIYVPMPSERRQHTCGRLDKVDGYVAICRRRPQHGGRHAALTVHGRVVAVWP